jgi:hypothetical protein
MGCHIPPKARAACPFRQFAWWKVLPATALGGRLHVAPFPSSIGLFLEKDFHGGDFDNPA